MSGPGRASGPRYVARSSLDSSFRHQRIPLYEGSLIGRVRQIVRLYFRRIIRVRRQRPDMPGAVGAHLPYADGHPRLALQLPDDTVRVACRRENELKIGLLKVVG